MGCPLPVFDLTDTHCHLNLPHYQEDLPLVMERAVEQGVRQILVPGIDLETSRQAINLSEKYPQVYAAVGVHPSSANEWTPAAVLELRELAQHPRVVAIGEIGLDYYRDHAPRPLQQQVLLAQLELAAEVGLPVVLHNRESFSDCWAIVDRWVQEICAAGLKMARRPGVFHSFDGDLKMAQQIVQNGFYLGISGPVTFTNAHQRHALVAELDPQTLLVETDAPYLTPHPHRGQRNEPAYIPQIVEKIARLQNVPVEEIVRSTTQNATQLFSWGVSL